MAWILRHTVPYDGKGMEALSCAACFMLSAPDWSSLLLVRSLSMMMMKITDRESCCRGIGLLLDGPDHVLRERPLELNCQRNMGEFGTLLVTCIRI